MYDWAKKRQKQRISEMKEFRAKLGLPPDIGPTALDITDGLSEDIWAEKECG